MELQREALRREVATLQYVTHASLFLSESFTTPDDPLTLTAVVIRSVSREGPDSGEMGGKGVPGGRGVCVCVCVCVCVKGAAASDRHHLAPFDI